MDATAENKAFAGDTRPFAQAVLQEGIHKQFTSSPITDRMTLGDLCYRGVGALGKHGKETKTSWDTLSYVLLQSHNVWMHINAVQEANRKYEQGVIPSMLMEERFDRVLVRDVIDAVFAARNKQRSLEIINEHDWLWTKFYKNLDTKTAFNSLFEVVESTTDDADSEELDADLAMVANLGE